MSFRFMLAPDGAFNDVISSLGLAGFDHGWLSDPKTALGTIILINVWQYTGYSFLIYDAALGQVDPGIIEAARMDGASTRQLTWGILFPMLKGSHLVLIVLGLIGSFKMFDLVYVTTGGGPGTSTQVISGYIYRQVIAQFHAGYGAALSILLVVLALVFAVFQVRLAQKAAA